MLKKLIANIIHRFGYEISQIQPVFDSQDGMQLFKYCKSDGTFDYEKYRLTQTAANKQKLKNVWVLEENIAFLSDYISKKITHATSGLCHGTRRGKEQEWFKKYLNCDVLGTEISDTANQFPHTIQWDFHEVKPEWIGSIDFIYSNSLDHSYDPEKCLTAWMSCLKKDGLCILEHTSGHARATEMDPFGASTSVMPYLILKWGKGNFCVREILDAPSKPISTKYVQYLIIQKF